MSNFVINEDYTEINKTLYYYTVGLLIQLVKEFVLQQKL